MTDLDLEALRRLLNDPENEPEIDPEYESLLISARDLEAILAALERAEKVEARAKALVRARALANPEWRTTAIDRLEAALEGRDG